ncbi:MAG: DUF445 domain-containing protein [SAR324 cluster bacterium]|uniref:DUF445 domain-containing protein n=1 Tax=SAR324 cluster bacterium TaxID=2024889 RepID=A0A7X9FT28_9DELT|nr:DUF445 domain-containing protein [SAR324 cluster bacterium]
MIVMRDSSEAVQWPVVRRMKSVATGLLLLMVLTFICSVIWMDKIPMLSWVRAFSEAAMIGALADWFAVVALFKHPLGIPIPHTAIIPSRKDEIGEMLGKFFRTNFFARPIIQSKLNKFDIVGRFGQWLSLLENRKKLAQRIIGIWPQIRAMFNDQHFNPMLEQSLKTLLRDANFSVILGNFLDLLVSSDKDGLMRAELARIGEELIENHQNYIRERLREEMPWYVPRFVHEKVYGRLLGRMRAILNELRNSPESETSKLCQRGIEELIRALKTSSDFHEYGEKVKVWLLESELLKNYGKELLEELQSRLLRETGGGGTLLGDLIMSTLDRFSKALETDENVRQNLSRSVEYGVLLLVQKHGEALVTLIAETVQAWDPHTLVEKIELQVGKDLQFIRLNGTIVGGFVGLIIHAITRVF